MGASVKPPTELSPQDLFYQKWAAQASGEILSNRSSSHPFTSHALNQCLHKIIQTLSQVEYGTTALVETCLLPLSY